MMHCSVTSEGRREQKRAVDAIFCVAKTAVAFYSTERQLAEDSIQQL